MGLWSDLPNELIYTIDKHFIMSYVDKIRFRAVCTSWNCYLPKLLFKFPLLLQPVDHNNGEPSHGLFNPVEKKAYELDFPEAQGKFFKGSSHGWVATTEDVPSSSPHDMYLINPLTRARIQLPSRSTFPDVKEYRADKAGQEYVRFWKDGSNIVFLTDACTVNNNLIYRVILSSDPSCDDCIAVAIYGEESRMAYCSCNDKRWTPLPVKVQDKDPITRPRGFQDFIFHKGKLHALNGWGQLVVYEDIGVDPIMMEIVVEPPSEEYQTEVMYLVESSDGGLLLVARYINHAECERDPSIVKTCWFGVCKLDLNNSNWVEVKNIGDDVLFVGSNSSISISSLDFPGYQGNSIYFTDSYCSVRHNKKEQKNSDIGVFSLEDGRIKSLPGLNCDSRFIWPLPIWLMRPSAISST